MNFYTIVVVVAASILILCLIGMGIIMNSANKSAPFPPGKGPCPDGWVVSGNTCLIPNASDEKDSAGNPIVLNIGKLKDDSAQRTFFQDPKNTPGITVSKLGLLSGESSVDFSNSGWSNGVLSTTCNQAKWARDYGISWDGITNYNGC